MKLNNIVPWPGIERHPGDPRTLSGGPDPQINRRENPRQQPSQQQQLQDALGGLLGGTKEEEAEIRGLGT